MRAIIRMIKKHYALILLIGFAYYHMKYKKKCLCKPVIKEGFEQEIDIDLTENKDNFDDVV